MTAIAASVASRLGFTSPTRNSRTGWIDGFRVLSHCGLGYWKLATQQTGERLQWTVHVLDRLAVGDAADEGVAAGAVLRVHLRGVQICVVGLGKPEARRHHADDRARHAAEQQRLADDVRVGTEVLPQSNN